MLNKKYWKMVSDLNNCFFFANFKGNFDILDTCNKYFGILTDVKSSESKGSCGDIFLTILTRILQYLIIRIIIQFLWNYNQI